MSKKLDIEDADIDNAVVDCAKGFKKSSQASFADAATTTAPSSATCTEMGAKRAKEFLVEAAGGGGAQDPAAKAPRIAPRESEVVTPRREQAPAAPKIDIAVARTTIARDEEDALASDVKKFWKSVVSTGTELCRNSDLATSNGLEFDASYTFAKEPLDLCLAFIGLRLLPSRRSRTLGT